GAALREVDEAGQPGQRVGVLHRQRLPEVEGEACLPRGGGLVAPAPRDPPEAGPRRAEVVLHREALGQGQHRLGQRLGLREVAPEPPGHHPVGERPQPEDEVARLLGVLDHPEEPGLGMVEAAVHEGHHPVDEVRVGD
ncbi:MAG: hypothetical protein ACK55I_48605, partial [bacterium]